MDHTDKLAGALQWLLDDMTDAGENKAPGSDIEFDSVAHARETLEAYRKDKHLISAALDSVIDQYHADSALPD